MKSIKGEGELFVIGFWLILFAIVYGISIFVKSYQCSNYGELASRETKYSIINGCFVKTKSGWIPKSEIRSEGVE